MTDSKRLVACAAGVVFVFHTAYINATSSEREVRPADLSMANAWLEIASAVEAYSGLKLWCTKLVVGSPAGIRTKILEAIRIQIWQQESPEEAVLAAVLEAEVSGGRLSREARQTASVVPEGTRATIEAAYGVQPVNQTSMRGLSLLPEGWAKETLRARIAEALGDTESAVRIRDVQAERGRGYVQSIAIRFSGFWLVVFAGAGFAIHWLARRGARVLSAQDRVIVLLPATALEIFALCVGAIAAAHIALRSIVLPALFSSGSDQGLDFVYRYWSVTATTATLALAYWLLRSALKTKESGSLCAELGFPRDRDSLVGLTCVGFMVALAYWAALALLSALLECFGIDCTLVREYPGTTASSASLVSLASVLLIGPLLEEVLYRQLLYGGLRKWLRPSVAAATSALIFSAAHPGNWSAHLALFWSGVVLALSFEWTKSLLPCIVAHSMVNLREILLI